MRNSPKAGLTSTGDWIAVGRKSYAELQPLENQTSVIPFTNDCWHPCITLAVWIAQTEISSVHN